MKFLSIELCLLKDKWSSYHLYLHFSLAKRLFMIYYHLRKRWP
jgi:hypothetical protein